MRFHCATGLGALRNCTPKREHWRRTRNQYLKNAVVWDDPISVYRLAQCAHVQSVIIRNISKTTVFLETPAIVLLSCLS